MNLSDIQGRPKLTKHVFSIFYFTYVSTKVNDKILNFFSKNAPQKASINKFISICFNNFSNTQNEQPTYTSIISKYVLLLFAHPIYNTI